MPLFGTAAIALDLKIETVQFMFETVVSPTTQVVSLSAGFGKAKGIVLIQTGARDLGPGHPDAYNNGSFCVGFSDGTNNVCAHTQHDSENTPTQICLRAQLGDHATYRVQSGVVANAISACDFTTDDQITFTVPVNDEAFSCQMIVIGGAHVDCKVGSHDDLGTGTGEQGITVSHATDVFFGLTSHDNIQHNRSGSPNPISTDGANLSWGCAINDGSQSQMGISWASASAVTPAQNTIGLYNDSIIASVSDGAVENNSLAVTGFTGTGVNVQADASMASAILQYMSLSFSQSVNMDIVDTTIPATSGNVSITSPGFQPGFGFWFNFIGVAAYNTPVDADFSLGQTMFDGTNTYTSCNKGRDGTDNTDGAAYGSSFNELTLMTDGGTDGEGLLVTSSGDSFTANGVDFTMSAWDSSTVPGRMLLIEAN